MPAYVTNNKNDGTPAAISSTALSLLVLYTLTATLRRLHIYEFTLGVYDTPANNTLLWDALRLTGPGTVTASTPNALDPGDSGAVAPGTVGVWATVEPTYTSKSDVFSRPLNQQVSTTWQSGGGSGDIIVPATNNNGIGWRAKSAGYTGTGAQVEVKYWT